MSEKTPISGFSPEPGTPERIADGLDAMAAQLQQAAEKLRVLAAEVRELGESLKNWIEVAMRAGEKMAQVPPCGLSSVVSEPAKERS